VTNADYAYEILQEAIREEGGEVPCQAYPDLFFPEQHDKDGPRDYAPAQAKKLCQGCPVMLQCGQYAIEAREEFGVWGGMSAYERKKLYVRKARR
jgi:WhiB family transcriptional regulator, redox-sensing transcriptional regulator